MNERLIQLVDLMLDAYPPDMTRTDDTVRVTGSQRQVIETARVERPCYSAGMLAMMLNDAPLANEICRASEGTPLWKESVRMYLLAWVGAS